MQRRKVLPHRPPLRIDTSREVWFITINTQPRGKNQLATAERWAELKESVEHRQQRGIWWPHLFLAMPDHCHALFSFPVGSPAMEKTIADWKHWIAFRTGVAWQRGFFDHRLRHNESFEEKASYIRNNPVRANLAINAEEWPYRWSPPDGLFTGLHR